MLKQTQIWFITIYMYTSVLFPMGTATTWPEGGFSGTAWLLVDLPRFPSITSDMFIGCFNAKTCSWSFTWTLTKFFTFPKFVIVLNYEIVSPLCTLILLALYDLMSFVKSFKCIVKRCYRLPPLPPWLSSCCGMLQQCKFHPPHIH